MRGAIVKHLAGFIVIAGSLLFALSIVKTQQEAARADALRLIAPYLAVTSIDLTDPLQATLFKEALRVFYPEGSRTDSIAAAVDAYALKMMTDAGYKGGRREQGLTSATVARLVWMYAQFVAVFVVVVVLTFLAARTLAVHKFIRMKRGDESPLRQLALLYSSLRSGARPPGTLKKAVTLSARSAFRGIVSLFLFSPAYVIAYAFKTELDTGNLLFMTALAVMSNGVLVSMTGTFFTFLVHESRKGYVETATVKGLDSSYNIHGQFGEEASASIRPLRAFSNHVFKHIYMNASFQYITALKEHVAFLITGLIIIEMALNIQGHLCYELLKSLLYEDYEVATAIIIGIFFAVKSTELLIDLWYERESKRYHNAI
jgi:hypothetical protein